MAEVGPPFDVPVKANPAGESNDLVFEALVKGVIVGRSEALAELHANTAPQIFPIAYRVLASKQDAEEIVSDVYRYVWRHAEQYDHTRGSVLAWLTIIARHRAIDRLRKRRLTHSIDDQSAEAWVAFAIADTPGPELLLAQLQRRVAVYAALGKLSPLRRTLIGLSFFGGLQP